MHRIDKIKLAQSWSLDMYFLTHDKEDLDIHVQALEDEVEFDGG